MNMFEKCLFASVLILSVSCTKETRFERLPAEKTGIDFNNAIVEKDSFNILHNEYMYNGGGVGAADLNNDGLTDLVFTGNKVLTRIYLNKGEFRFQDITSSFENLTNDQWYSGVSVVDINNDGWLDVYLTATFSPDPDKRKNKLWVNQGNAEGQSPSFKEMAEHYGIADDGHSVHAGFFDFDLDGDLDLYVLNNIVNKAVPTNYREKITDGSSINNDRLYRNEGNGTFSDVTKEAGIVYEGYGLGLAFGDVNKDGYPDIYVSNDYIANDILYLNEQNGTFKNATKNLISYQSRFSMGNDVVDINNDGNLDIMTVDMMPEAYFRKKQTINGNSYVVYINNEKYGYEPQYVRNMVHLHNGFANGQMLPYSEVGQMMGVFQTEWSWSPLFADFDNDGDRDLFITNGFPKDLTDKDFTNYKAQVYGFVAGDQHMINRIPVVKVSNYSYENNGEYSFSNRTEEWGMNIPSFSNGAAFVDLDNDGDLDYAVNNINDQAFIYRNNTIGSLQEATNFLRIVLKGKDPNKLAIGAKVELWTEGKLQYYEQFLTRGYISSVDPVIHFGLGDKTKVDSMRITWPKNNTHTLFRNVQANQLLTVNESSSEPIRQVENLQAHPPLLFTPAKQLLDYKHEEEDYIDFFQNQRIIQHKLSQIGPCLAKGDLNGDGHDDVVVGGSKVSPTALFLFDGTQFVNASVPGLTELKKCTESDMAVLDVEGDGDQDVVAISGGYENENDGDYQHYLYRNDGASFSREVLPIPAFPASVIRPVDYDHDGDTDLFVGARVKRSQYPYAPASYIVINEGGSFLKSEALELGMVTDAVWSDYDQDGWKDLIITREWNTIVLLENQQGKNFRLKEEAMDDKHGFWSSVAAADLDGDGDDDYVVGNLGENHRLHVSDEMPMRLYAVDIDENTFIDPVATAYWKDEKGTMREFPINYLDELAAQSPFFRRKFTSYTSFSYSSIDSILDKSALNPKSIFHANTTSSFIVWNEGKGFVFEKLPPAVQTAPVKKILVRDFNGDAQLDILIAGNDYSFDVSTGYFDANKGILLAGKGEKKFELLPPSKSGLVLKGQVTALFYFEENNPFLLAGINRDSITTVHHNSGNKARPMLSGR